MTAQTNNILRSFLQGVTGAGLFRRLDYPGAPKEFVDSRSLSQIQAGGEFDKACRDYQKAVLDKQRDEVSQRARAEKAAKENVAVRH